MTSDYNGKVLDLCVSDRDFYVGAYKYTLTARVMEERYVTFCLTFYQREVRGFLVVLLSFCGVARM